MRRLGRWIRRIWRGFWEAVWQGIENFEKHMFWVGVVVGALAFPIIRGIIRLIYAVPGWFLTLCPLIIITITALVVIVSRSRR